jgi:lysophospholipase L1-like esterase
MTFKTLFAFVFFFGLNPIGFPMNSYSQSNTIATKSQLFTFGTKSKNKKGIQIDSPIRYDSKIGYGFDFNTAQNVQINLDNCSIQKSTYFSIKLPEGNYSVNVTVGSNEHESHLTIKAESRRIMLAEQIIPKGKEQTKSFTINVRTPQIDNKSAITLKDRELSELNWDNKLSLEFLGAVVIRKIEIIPISKVTTLFLAGDSTVTDQDLEPLASWGQCITQYFDTSVVVANYAVSGASLSSFKSSGRLKKIETMIQAGDYLIIEFGHNDEKIKGVENGPWGSYSDLLTEFIQMAKSKGATPILVTPTQRRFFNENGTLKPTHGEFPDAMRAVATKNKVSLIDITKMTTDLYEAWGDHLSRKAFVQYPANTFPGQANPLEDNTHFNSFGGNEIARCVLEGIRELPLHLKKHIQPSVATYNPKQPNAFSNWTLPMSSRFEAIKPEGN